MKTVQWILIGCRVFALSSSLFLLAGCGGTGDGTGSGGEVTAEDQMKKAEESKRAMEAASTTKKK